ncbi:MAG: DUF2064 domain-containing protein [Chloroflexota bacterium]|nr:DUF2064 domain-containing protein [Chloroflexota bacterium]
MASAPTVSHGVAAVVPVLDEVTAIGPLVRGLRLAGACCVYAIDGGSRDGTQAAAEAAGARVVGEPRRGYGRACITGGEKAMHDGHEVIAFLDGDGSCDPADLPALVAGLEDGDLVLGRRSQALTEHGALPWHARLGNMLVTRVLAVRTGRRVGDLSPFKVIRSAALLRLRADHAGYGWTVQLIARALTDPTTRLMERPIRFRTRRGGRSKVSGQLRASLDAGRAMLSMAMAESRPRPVLALMAKAPRDGHAKTRLAADIGQAETRDLWAACLSDGAASLGGAARMLRLRRLVVVPEERDELPVRDLLDSGWSVDIQQRAGLSGGLVDCFLRAFDLGASSAVAVGADSPTLPHDRLAMAISILAGDDKFDADAGGPASPSPAVLGSCLDGGYYLVGVGWRQRRPLLGAWQRRRLEARLERVFGAARMGGSDALSTTRQALASAGWQPTLLPPWDDLDVGADLRALALSVEGRPADFPRLSAWLKRNAVLVQRWS